MQAMETPDNLFPYPSDPLTRIGFIIGDIINVGVLLLILLPIMAAFKH